MCVCVFVCVCVCVKINLKEKHVATNENPTPVPLITSRVCYHYTTATTMDMYVSFPGQFFFIA